MRPRLHEPDQAVLLGALSVNLDPFYGVPPSQAAGDRRKPLPRHEALDHGLVGRTDLPQRGGIDRSQQKDLVGRVQRRSLDADEHLVGARFLDRGVLQPDPQSAFGVDERSYPAIDENHAAPPL